MRRAFIGTLVLVVVVATAVFVAFRQPVTVHVSGDLAADLSALVPGVNYATDYDEAKVQIIAVTDWDKLSFVPGAVKLCGSDCRSTSGNVVVRIVGVGIAGVQKVVFLNIAAFLSDADPGIFALSDHGRECLAIGLSLEIGSLRPENWPKDCAADSAVVSRLKLGVS